MKQEDEGSLAIKLHSPQSAKRPAAVPSSIRITCHGLRSNLLHSLFGFYLDDLQPNSVDLGHSVSSLMYSTKHRFLKPYGSLYGLHFTRFCEVPTTLLY